MAFPLIHKVYEYEGRLVLVWGVDMFIKVYVREADLDSRFEYFTINWFKFLFKAKKA